MDLNIVLRGQSNAYWFLTYGDAEKLKSTVERYLGFDGINDKVNLVADVAPWDVTNNMPAAGEYTIFSGTAFLPGSSGASGQSWISPFENGDWRTGWKSNPYHLGFINELSGLSAAQKAAPTAVLWFHSESDSWNYTNVTAEQWISGVRYDANLVRTTLGQAAATVPYIFVEAIPVGGGSDLTVQAIRVGMDTLAADPFFNASIGAQFGDVDMNHDGKYGGAHMSASDSLLLLERSARSIAEEFASYALAGSPIAQAGGNIASLGPQVSKASINLASPDQLILEIAHDAATGFQSIDPDAATGLGWSIHYGGSVLLATSAAIVDSTHLMLKFPQNIPQEVGALLHYAFGSQRLAVGETSGSGNAIYDNHGLPIWTFSAGVKIVPSTQQPPSPGPDTTLPVLKMTSQTLAQDTGRSQTDFITRNGVITLQGTVSDDRPGVVVEVWSGSVKLSDSVQIDANGNWSHKITLPEGAHQMRVSATDGAGNMTDVSASRPIVVDSTPPSEPSIGRISVSAKGAFKLLGIGEANSTVTIFEGTKSLGAADVDGTGRWEFTTGSMSPNSHSFRANSTDTAGNTSTNSGLAIYGGKNAETLTGADKNDLIIGAAGNDALFGMGGRDAFVFTPGFGKDTIRDFNVGSSTDDRYDKVLFSSALFSSVDGILARLGETNGNAIITLDPQNSVVFAGVKVQDLKHYHFDIW
ncbi:hypothetical protein JKG68_10455 [Microvirga aerilata]|uniref:Calcium-binding protein n=1 Tax=Microvirga aerilata TaxID=670292 RepID=A0A936Z753_9HYPH|nr:Ig-like domain-containing protein [Microvirga aerilata]MBL0404391.1 hypothetical protein [Microvirga aerilata]